MPDRSADPPARRNVSETELAVLKVLWASDAPCTVRDVVDAFEADGRDLAYTTVATLLARLEDKGTVASVRRGLAKTFRATVTRDDLLDRRLARLRDELAGGANLPILHALVRGGGLTRDELDALERLVDDARRREGP